MNRTDRLLAITLELHAHRYTRAEDLATQFEVSVRTVYRDIEALCEAGVPVVATPGYGYSLAEGYFLAPVMLTADEAGMLLGTYYIKPNQPGLGAHVCNCGYIVAAAVRGQGIASRLCEHSQEEARRLGFRAMQFNLVVSTNTGAVRLWQTLGFPIVGTLPGAFNHPRLGYVDAYVMYKQLSG